jgi:hypothetical protein
VEEGSVRLKHGEAFDEKAGMKILHERRPLMKGRKVEGGYGHGE